MHVSVYHSFLVPLSVLIHKYPEIFMEKSVLDKNETSLTLMNLQVKLLLYNSAQKFYGITNQNVCIYVRC